MTQMLIFTDLDGTLLEHKTYSYEPALPALKQVEKHNIPLIFSTSKTRAEIEYWQKQLKNSHPFISENGGGIFIPKNYFSFEYPYDKKIKNFKVIELGMPYRSLLKIVRKIQQQYELQSFADMNPSDLSKETGLSLEQAALALSRDYELPFKLLNPYEKDDVLAEIKKHKLSVIIGGIYYHLMANQSKGKAVARLLNLFSKQYPSLKTIALGDTFNDVSMLDLVDIPYLVQRPDGSYISSSYNHADGIGPVGWCSAVSFEIQNHQ